jgi:hypothetical protein
MSVLPFHPDQTSGRDRRTVRNASVALALGLCLRRCPNTRRPFSTVTQTRVPAMSRHARAKAAARGRGRVQSKQGLHEHT